MHSRRGASTTGVRWSSTGSRKLAQLGIGKTAVDDLGGNRLLWAMGALAYQLLHVIRTTALTGSWRRAQPERIRSWMLRLSAKLTRHARKTYVQSATLRAGPRRTPSRTPLHRAPQSSAAQSLSILRAHAREPRPSEPSTVVLPSSPAPSKAPTPDVARCSALHLISNSCVSKQRPARRRTINIRPQPLCAGSGINVADGPDVLAVNLDIHASWIAFRSGPNTKPDLVSPGGALVVVFSATGDHPSSKGSCNVSGSSRPRTVRVAGPSTR